MPGPPHGVWSYFISFLKNNHLRIVPSADTCVGKSWIYVLSGFVSLFRADPAWDINIKYVLYLIYI